MFSRRALQRPLVLCMRYLLEESVMPGQMLVFEPSKVSMVNKFCFHALSRLEVCGSVRKY